MTVPYKKKLIEVALPLEAINKASAREKSIRHGHPSTLHLWWARRPLAAARAVIFAQMVDDPSEYTDVLLSDPNKKRSAKAHHKKRLEEWEVKTKDGEPATPKPTLEESAAELERDRLFKIIEELVLWENTTNEEVLEKARAEIWQSWRRACAENVEHPQAKELFDRHKLPAFHDPFAGGGALPLEAQRLGLESYASDLNPVAVLINKAMIEIPPKFAGKPPINPEARNDQRLFTQGWRGAQGLAEDVRYYGQWMRDEAEKRIGHLYPKVEITKEMVEERPDLKRYEGRELTVIAWLWARTVKSPNPAFSQIDVPLVSTFMLSTKAGKEAYVEPVIENGGYRFTVKIGKPKNAEAAKNGTKLARGANFRCLMSGEPMVGNYIKAEGMAGRMGARLMAIVAEGNRGRVYLSPTQEHEDIAEQAQPKWKPEIVISGSSQYLGIKPYGIEFFSELFTNRQMVALTTFSDLVQVVLQQTEQDALASGLKNDGIGLDDGGQGAQAYAEAISVYLGLASSRASDAWSKIVSWRNGVEATRGTFSRQALPIIWDYTEANPLSCSCGNWIGACLEWVVKAIGALPFQVISEACQADASSQTISINKCVSTDPPYYDNVPYADLSDFFYVWLRRSLKHVFSNLFATLAVPKSEELVAFAHRHSNRKEARDFFMNGMTHAMHQVAMQAHLNFPVTIFYAFKQSETEDANTASTGWETFLDAVINAGFSITGTWPMSTEREARSRSIGSNALASSIVLVCRKRVEDAPTATRREFLAALKEELPAALTHLQRGNIAPVDLAQASIGPGMAVYTRYAKVLDAEGKPLSVRDALTLINQTLDEALAEQEGDFDSDTRWALAWFDQYGYKEAEFGQADVLARAKNTSVAGLVEAGIIFSKGGKVRLLKPEELPGDWNPMTDPRLTVWEVSLHLIRALQEQGEAAAAKIRAQIGAHAGAARELAYRQYTLCERKKWAQEALAFNSLVISWPEIERLARETVKPQAEQKNLFDEEG